MVSSSTFTVAALYRYPVKGLAPQKLLETTLKAGDCVPLDRAWAIENGPGRFDPDNPAPLPKINFLMLMRNARLAALGIDFYEATHTLTLIRNGRQVVKGSLETATGRQLIEQFIAGYMDGAIRGPPRLVAAPGHSFSDVPVKCLHVVNLASVRELERALGRPVDPLRFRANLYIDAPEPWIEFDWMESEIAAGGARLRVIDRTGRCEATNVAPGSGNRDLAIPASLARTYGHSDFGVYATVVHGGTVRTGDTVETG